MIEKKEKLRRGWFGMLRFPGKMLFFSCLHHSVTDPKCLSYLCSLPVRSVPNIGIAESSQHFSNEPEEQDICDRLPVVTLQNYKAFFPVSVSFLQACGPLWREHSIFLNVHYFLFYLFFHTNPSFFFVWTK